MSTIELADRQQIQRRGKEPNPSRPADGMKKQVRGVSIRLDDRGHQLENQRHSKNDICIRVKRERRNYSRVENSIG